ncbi:MAG TPA: hypothetical protein VHD69_00690 [Candidatus Paceibacterota bacterium]|jgi:hypothetical protein|nr:hypothetical protein [Candidatus Paceibacterota bacterium]
MYQNKNLQIPFLNGQIIFIGSRSAPNAEGRLLTFTADWLEFEGKFGEEVTHLDQYKRHIESVFENTCIMTQIAIDKLSKLHKTIAIFAVYVAEPPVRDERRFMESVRRKFEDSIKKARDETFLTNQAVLAAAL